MASVSAAALLWPTTAHAEPISASIAALIFTVGTTAYVVATTVITIALSIGLSIGLNLLLAPSRPPIPKPADGSAPLQQAIPPVQYAVGRTRMAGSFMWFAKVGGNLYMVTAVKDGFFCEIEHYYLNDDEVTLNPDGTVDSGTVYQHFVRFLWWDGSPMPDGTALIDNPLKPIIDAFSPDLDENFRPDGIAALGLLCGSVPSENFSGIYPNGRPQPSIAGKTTRLYDPRDETQDVDDETTWQFSANNALVRIWYECFCPHGPRRSYDIAVVPRLATWIEQADACDDPIALKAGGTVPRYECGFWWQSTTERAQVRASIMASCDGWDCEFGDGSFVMLVGKYIAPTETLTDDDIVGYQLESDTLDGEYTNSLSIKWTNPDEQYGEQDAPPWEDDEAISEYGLRSSSVDLWPVQNQSQARRLAKRLFLRANAPLRGTLTTNLASLRLIGDRWAIVQSDKIAPLANSVIEIKNQKTDLVNLRRTIEFVVVNPNVLDAWDAATEEGEPPPATYEPVNDTPPVPDNVDAVATGEEMSDYTTGVTLAVSWDEVPDRTDLTWTVQYQQSGADGWIEMPVASPTIAGGRVYAQTGFVTVGSIYYVQVQSHGVGGPSGYSTPAVLVLTDTTNIAPGPPTSPSTAGGVGEVQVLWNNPLSTNFASASVWRAAVGDPFGSATLVTSGITGASGAAASYANTGLAAGSYDFWITAENAYGTSSTPAGPVTGTAT